MKHNCSVVLLKSLHNQISCIK